MIMERKSKKLIVRVTESQLRALTDILLEEEITKSTFLRRMLNKYLADESKNSSSLKKKKQ